MADLSNDQLQLISDEIKAALANAEQHRVIVVDNAIVVSWFGTLYLQSTLIRKIGAIAAENELVIGISAGNAIPGYTNIVIK